MFFSRPAGHKFVDRESISDYDFTISDLIVDSNYHDLDLSSKVPVGTTAVLIYYIISHNFPNNTFKLRNKDFTTDFNAFVLHTMTADIFQYDCCTVSCNADRKMEYSLQIGAGEWFCNLTIAGWWA